MEILRFGPGSRRPHAGAGSQGLALQIIWGDPRARVTELAFSRHGLMAPQTSPGHGLLIVVSGGGWVQIGDERAAINHGEAVEWPPGVAHGAWTDGSPMRAILVEVPVAIIEGSHRRIIPAVASDVARRMSEGVSARGGLAPRDIPPLDHDGSEGEPW